MLPPIERHPSFRKRAGFAAVLAVAAMLASAVAFVRGRSDVVVPFLATGAALAALALVPVAGRWFYVGWMMLGRAIGRITGPIVLGVVFVAVFVPIGVVRRMLGHDPLARRRKPEGESYWERPPDRARGIDYFRPY